MLTGIGTQTYVVHIAGTAAGLIDRGGAPMGQCSGIIDRTQSMNLLSGSATDHDVVQQDVPNLVALSALRVATHIPHV